MTGSQAVGPSSAPFLGTLAVSWNRNGAAETQTSAPVWCDSSVVGSGLTCCVRIGSLQSSYLDILTLMANYGCFLSHGSFYNLIFISAAEKL